MQNNTTDYVDVAINYIMRYGYPSACDHTDVDDYVDAVLDAGVSAWGSANASQKSALSKWARDDWAAYQDA